MMTTAPLQPHGTDVIDGITAQGVDAVLRACARAGVVVTADGPDLEVWTEDGSPIPAALIAALRDHKAALLAILAGKRPQRGYCWTCGERLPLEPHLLYAHCAGCAVAALARLPGSAHFAHSACHRRDDDGPSQPLHAPDA